MTKDNFSMILATNEDGVIGSVDGGLAWDLPDDLARFKEITSGPNKIVVMGTNTYLTLPARGLPNRHNVVVGKTFYGDPENPSEVHFEPDFESTLKYLEQFSDKHEIFFIGGVGIYEAALPYCKKVHLTLVHRPVFNWADMIEGFLMLPFTTKFDTPPNFSDFHCPDEPELCTYHSQQLGIMIPSHTFYTLVRK